MIKLKILGVGGAFARIKCHKKKVGLIFNSNFLLEKDGRYVLIDYGRTVNDALDFFGLDRTRIDHILISHLHNDHIGGLEELGILNKVFFNRRQKLISTPSILTKLWENSLKGGLEYLENASAKPSPKNFPDYFDALEIKPYEFFTLRGFEELRIKFLPTHHIHGMESYGFVLQMENTKVFISGDTLFDEKFILENSEGADLVLHDCQIAETGRNNIDGVHASLRQLRELPAWVKNKMYLYHYDLGLEKPDIGRDFAGYGYAGQEFQL